MKIKSLKDAFAGAVNGSFVGGVVLLVSSAFDSSFLNAFTAVTGCLALWKGAESGKELVLSVAFCAAAAVGGVEYMNREAQTASPPATPASMPAAGQRLF